MAEPSVTQKSPKWMRITLFCSLAANLLVVGLVAGLALSGGPEKRANAQPREAGALFTRALSSEDKRALRREFVRGLRSDGPDRGPILGGVQASLDALRATPFDADAFAETMAEQSSRRAQRDALGRQALTARVAAMTDAERLSYADRVEDGLRDLRKRFRPRD